MAKQSSAPTKFRPERPILLNTENTNLKTPDEVIEAVEKLRSRGWLCAIGEKSRPFHMSFNDVSEFQEFKKDASALNVTLKTPLIKPDDLDAFEAEDNAGQIMPEATATSSYEDPTGKVHIGE